MTAIDRDAAETEPPAPVMRDSDLMFLAMRAIEEVARKMQRFEYDDELDRILGRATELLTWATWNIEHRRAS